MNNARYSEQPKEANLMIGILAAVVGFHSIVAQSAGHMVFGRIGGAQAIGFGVIVLCFGLFGLRLYLQPCSRILREVRGRLVVLVTLYCASVSALFVRGGGGAALFRSVPLIITLVAGHAFHRRVVHALRERARTGSRADGVGP